MPQHRMFHFAILAVPCQGTGDLNKVDLDVSRDTGICDEVIKGFRDKRISVNERCLSDLMQITSSDLHVRTIRKKM